MYSYRGNPVNSDDASSPNSILPALPEYGAISANMFQKEPRAAHIHNPNLSQEEEYSSRPVTLHDLKISKIILGICRYF
jgi:hypothetical protein